MTTYLKPAAVAKHFLVTAETVRRWCEEGRFPGAVKTPSGRWLIPASEIAQ